uniref:Uncharacterized protein n=1 Tax=Pyrodinium bahamense TaxID=73915 RepID=A0A7S0F9M7_9DINO|mmetsp:Transcript_15309/g.42276  ORF Transcript_15309/g.42276 Transcript_15309/m.42276 type:complete len:706 (+) Transcript_15309:59-2176(+)
MDVQPQNVTLQLQEYNQLYEQAYLNEKRAALAKERSALEDQKRQQEAALKEKERRLEEAHARGARESRGAVTSRNWLLTGHAVEGSCGPGATSQEGATATFDFVFELRIFDPEWTMVPMVDSQVITENWVVQRLSAKEVAAGDAEPAWAPVPLGLDTLLVAQELDGMPERQVLATNVPGLYRVSFSAHVFVHSARNLRSLSLALVHPITAARLRLRQAGDSRSRVSELSVTPAARYTVAEADGVVDISMRLPLTKTLEVKWRGVEDNDGDWERMSREGANCKSVEEEPPQVTATHDAMHSIMDGILQSSHTLKFSADSEERALNSVRLAVHGATRVTSVSGHGVASWRATPAVSEGDAESSTSVEVSFRSSLISDTVIVLLNTELELGTAASVTIPSLVCEDVLRQTGSLAVVKVANVEVHAQEARGMARVGVDELPPELKCQTSRPIMFAYKYLSPQSRVALGIVKHEQVDVLEAVAESALYEVLVSDGQSMHRLMLNLQNSRKQYLQVHGIPLEARLWSLMVNSKPAKPVRAEDGSLLIPLLVGASGDSNDGAQAASVELAYLLQRSTLGERGTAALAPPRLDVPISRLLVEVQWPETYEVTFKSSATSAQSFSSPLPRPVNHDVGMDLVASGFDFNRAPASVPKAGVNVQVPRAGRRHRFEQLLVVDGGATLTAHYQMKASEEEEANGWFAPLARRFCARRR